MSEYLLILVYALLPFAGVMLGGLLAEVLPASRRVIGAALHASAGVAIAVVSIDLMPRVLEGAPIWGISLAFLVGAAIAFSLARGIALMQRRMGGARGDTAAWMVYAAIGADLVSDGLVAGAGGAVATSLGVFLAAAQAIANIPGGFAAAANLRARNISGGRRLVAHIVLAIAALFAASVSYIALRGGDPMAQALALAAVAGVLLLATVEDIIPEGDAPKPPRWLSTLGFSLAFAGMAMISGSVD